VSPAVVIVIALIVAVLFLWGDREMREAERERQGRYEAEARADAFESLFLEEAREKL
jgi:CHASE3 domain sensor protein